LEQNPVLDPVLYFGAFRLPVYSLTLLIAVVVAIAGSLYRARDRGTQGIDAVLAALVGGLIAARLEYVALTGAYFAAHPDEILRLDLGGLGWHGAVIGAYAGLAIMTRWRGLDRRALLAAFAGALPLIALAGWIGCAAAGCGYGREVDTLANYPDWLVWEARDVYGIRVPRYATARFGMGLALIVALVGAVARGTRRFWAMLAVLSAGMFAIGFVRADASPLVAGLRADQIIDVLFVLAAVQRTLSPESIEKREADF